MKKTRLANGLEIYEINSHETSFLYDEIFVQEVYATLGIELEQDAVVIDVGANIGLFALYWLQKVDGLAIHCFEPLPECLEVLRANLADHEKAVIVPKALGATSGSMQITYYPNYTIMSSLFADAAEDLDTLRAGARADMKARVGRELDDRILDSFVKNRLVNEKVLDCEVETISAYLDRCDVARVDLLKIDVEKAEMLVVQGIKPEHWERIHQLVIEVHDQGNQEQEQLKELLESHGFEVRLMVEPMLDSADLYVLVAKRK